MSLFAGVDACKGGWLVAISPAWPCRERPAVAVCPDFRAVLALTAECRRVAVDIPMGLPSGKRMRKCDAEARALLQKLDHQSSAVFRTPPRESLNAASPAEFQRRHRKTTSVGAGYPVWGIVEKIRQADECLTPALQRRVIEFHPELAWLRLAGANLASKHTPEGVAQRKKLLQRLVPGLDSLFKWKDQLGRAAAEDDILDALVGIGVAKSSLRSAVHRLPAESEETDRRGLRMEIWY